MPRLTGSIRNDFFYLQANQLSSYQLRGGRGYDTLKVSGSGNTTVSQTVTSQWREIEAVDLSNFTGAINLAIDPLTLSTSGTGALDLTLGASSQISLSSAQAGVKLWGTGGATLSSATANIVEIASAGISLVGGLQNDRITASVFGNRLDGGGGDDTLVGNGGADVFVHRSGHGTDTFVNLNTAQDKIALDGFMNLNWHDLSQAMTQVGADTVVTLPDSASLVLRNVSLTTLTKSNFTSDGLELAEYGSVITIQPGTSAAAINALINDVPPGTTLVFANGAHVLNEAIVIQRDDIALRGESETGTILRFDFPVGQGGDFVKIGQVSKTNVTTSSVDAAAGSTTLTLANASALQAGDVIYVYQPNTADYLTSNNWTNVNMTEAEMRPFREFIVTVTAVNGNTVTLADALPYGFAATETRVFEMDLTTGVSLENVTITSSFGAPDDYSFTNTQTAFDSSSSILASGTQGLVINNVTLLNNPSNGLTLSSTIDALVTNLTVDGALNKGGDGNGYGVLLSEAFSNSLSGLAITDTRHAVVFSAWNAESGNVVHVLDTNRDINFHGSPDNGNMVTVDHIALGYNTAIDPSQWSIVSGGGTNHAATDIWNNNAVKFTFAIGAGNVDVMQGSDAGSYLNGMGSNDTLIGGAGNDVLVGNVRRDTLTGGAGQDTFVFKMGDDLDTITDMQFGAAGDKIVIMGNATVDGYEDLIFTQVGADLRVRYGANSTFILQNTTQQQVDASNFVFDPQSQNWLDEWSGLL